MRHGLIVLAGLLASGNPQTGQDVVRSMHDRYAGKWYRTLTFLQRNTAFLPADSVERSTWFERAAIPGTLRIDFRDGRGFSPSGGLLFARDSQFVIQSDTLVHASAFVHPLMVLGFDVYAQPADRTVDQLRRLGFDLSTVREDSWQGRPVYVVGAKAGDLHARQFWVDKERLVFVRMLEPGTRDTTRTSETQFNRYTQYGGGWVAVEVLFLVDGERRWLEEYADVRVGTPFPDGVFDVKRWKATR
ncbi:MAG: hypothetical protein ACREMF_03215 [Gemmatimonadales bacterium]